MFVTSDIFDIKPIALRRGLAWQENLLGGIEVHGTNWPGCRTAMRFLEAAGYRCGLIEKIGFTDPTQDDLPDEEEIFASLLRSERVAGGTPIDSFVFGGEARAIRYRDYKTNPMPIDGPSWRFTAALVFPLDEDPIELSSYVLKLSVDILGAEYGYHFIRDAFCDLWLYTVGGFASLDDTQIYESDAQEISDWADFVNDGHLWSGPWPKLRDLFQVNLLSPRHISARIGGLSLYDWVDAESGRGQMEYNSRGYWLWTLTDAEIFSVRPLLNAAGLLVSCLPRVYRDLPSEVTVCPPADSPD